MKILHRVLGKGRSQRDATQKICSISIVLCIFVCAVFIFNQEGVQKTNTGQRQLKIRKGFDSGLGIPSLSSFVETQKLKYKRRREEWDKVIERFEKQKRYHRLPDVIGIGVRKCGTGALNLFLGNHPYVRRDQEAHYYDMYSEKGLEFYKKELLPTAAKDEILFEKTPAYFFTLPYELPDIIRRDIPNVKLILVLCDPVTRALSDYAHRILNKNKKSTGKDFSAYMKEYFPPVKEMFHNLTIEREKHTLESTVRQLSTDRPKLSFAYGVYSYFIKRWTDNFSPSELLIIDGEKFLKEPGIVMETIQTFIGIPKMLLQEDFVKVPSTGLFCIRQWWNKNYDFVAELFSDSWQDNVLCTKGRMKGRTRSKNASFSMFFRERNELRRFYRPYNEILYRMLNTTFDWL